MKHGQSGDFSLIPFQQKLEENNLYPLKPSQLEIFQVNIGKMCNQTCRHCHVDAGPEVCISFLLLDYSNYIWHILLLEYRKCFSQPL